MWYSLMQPPVLGPASWLDNLSSMSPCWIVAVVSAGLGSGMLLSFPAEQDPAW